MMYLLKSYGKRILPWGASMGYCLSAMAATPPPPILTLKPAEICTGGSGTGQVSRVALARAIVDAYSLPQSVVDWKNTGIISYEDNVRAITVPLCSGGGNPSDARCKLPSASTQYTAVQDVAEAFSQAASKDTSDFKISFPTFSILVHRIRPVSSLDKSRQPVLNYASVSIAAQVFSRDPQFFQLSCSPIQSDGSGKLAHEGPSPALTGTTGSRPQPPSATASGGWPPDPAGGQNSGIIENIRNRIRVRYQPQDLNVGRDADAFAGLQAASLAIVDDSIAKKNSFDLHLTLGYNLPSLQLGGGGAILESVPFIKYDRDYVEAKTVPPGSDVHNLGFGIQESLTFPITDSFFNNVIVQPEYIFSLKRNAQVFKLHLADQPEPLLPTLGYAWSPSIGGISVISYVRPTLNVGTVVRSAAEPTLAATNAFVQGGINIGGSIYDAAEGTFFNGFSIPVDYVYLHGFTGQFKTVQEVTVGVNYTFPKTKYVTVGASYTNGRNTDTFEKQQLIKLSLGLKY